MENGKRADRTCRTSVRVLAGKALLATGVEREFFVARVFATVPAVPSTFDGVVTRIRVASSISDPFSIFDQAFGLVDSGIARV